MSIVRFGYVVGLGLAATLAGCGSYPEQPHGELQTRKQNPIPVCTTQLPPARRAAGDKAAVRTLDPDQWLGVVVPGYSEERGLGPTDVDCTGHYVFANETLRGGISKSGWPRKLDPDAVEVRSGPEGLRAIWVRALTFENGDEGGLVALVRASGDRADVYGVGSFRAPAKGTKLSPVRLGNDNLVVAETKSCPDPDDCRQRAHFYLARRGRLIEAASVDLERTAVVPSVTERGLYARYVLRTDVSYKPNGIQLLEQVRVKIVKYDDSNRDSDRELRRVEFQRFLRVERDTIFSSNDPLWERVVGQD
ncbi:hypothetical protein WME75_26505 [Sorangium sp. So ce1014]|uniref:hypothetical protein n=1 Tax=Sorangium sp. So ce1014 TaxID=3133326 RepID=UPI003F633AB3